MLRIFLIAFCLTSLSTISFAQVASVQSGDWNDLNTWDCACVPDFNDGIITISDATTVTIPNGFSVTADQIEFENNFGGTTGILSVASGGTLIVNDGPGDDIRLLNDFSTFALLEVFGTLQLNTGATIVDDDYGNLGIGPLPVTSDTYKVRNGGVHIHTTGSGVDAVPAAEWATGSTCRINATSDIAVPTIDPNISFYNFTWDGTNQGSGVSDLTGNLRTVNGNLTILNTNGQILRLAGANAYTLNIGGDFLIQGNSRVQFLTITVTSTINVQGDLNISSTNSTTNAITFNVTATMTVNVNGDFIKTNASPVSMLAGTSGSTTLNVDGDFSVTGGSLTRGATPGSGIVNINFSGASSQAFTNTATISNQLNFAVLNGSTVDLGTSAITGTGQFTLNGGATLIVRSPDGLVVGSTSGNLRNTGTRSYLANSNIIYAGASQNLGNEWGGGGALSGVAVNLEIDDGAVVTNDNIGSINLVGALTLTDGRLNIGNSNTLVIQGIFNSTSSGFIGGSTTSDLTFSGTGTVSTLNFASGSETLRNFTLSRSASITLGTDLIVEGVLAFTSSGNLNISDRTLTIQNNDGDITQSGSGGFVSNSNTNLVLAGTEALTIIPFSGSGNQLNDLTLSRTGTSPSYTWDATVVVNGTVSLNSGVLTHNSGLTMASGSTFIRNAGSSLTTTAPLTSGSYNVVYNGNLTTGLELPSGTTELNNLTVAGNVVLDKAITVNGILTFSSGVFNAGSNPMDIQGNLVSNSGATLTSSPITFSGTTTISGTTAPTFGSVTISGTVTPNINIRFDGNLVNNGTLAVGTGSQTTTFGGTTTISGSSVSSFNNVTIANTLTAPTGNFNVAGNWVNNGTFVRGPRTNTVTFNGTTSISGSTLTQFSGVTISGTLNSPATLSLAGNFTNNGTFNSGTGTVLFSGNNQQVVQGSTVTTFNNITVTNVSGPPAVQVLSNQNLRGVLTLSAGSVFDADGAGSIVFTLLSSADNPTVDASIATLPTGASVTGNVTVQRYMAIEGANNGRIYRYISSPVQTPAVSQIQSEIPITGTFTGASSCTGCGTNQSMFAYDESIITGDLNDGYINFPAASNTETLTTGRGYAIFVRGNITPISSAGSALWDVRAPINSGNISFNSHVSFTSSGNIANDGWNLVGNPYPSTIDWDAASGWTRTGINNAIYMRDNGVQSPVIATYIGGVGLNGGSQYIPIGQAFFVKSDGGPIDFQATENVKVAGTQSEFIREGSINDMLRIALRGGVISDETVIRFESTATEEFDQTFDAYKLKNAAFNISSKTGEINLAVNTLPEMTCVKSVDLEITDAAPGPYKLEFSEFDSFVNESISIKLVDNLLGETIDIREQGIYEFDITEDEQSQGVRFSVVFSLPEVDQSLTPQGEATNCAGNEYEIKLPASQPGISYYAVLGGNSISEIISGNGETLSISIDAEKLQPGENSILVFARQATCDAVPLEKAVDVNLVEMVPAEIQTSGNTLTSNYEDGNQWYLDGDPIDGATSQYFEAEVSGLYRLTVTSQDGCSTSTERQFVVTALEESIDKVIRVYPNPAKDYLKVEIDSAEPVQVKLLNVLGIEIEAKNLTGSGLSKQAEFDLTNQSNGMYILHVQKGGRVHQVKIIKTNE